MAKHQGKSLTVEIWDALLNGGAGDYAHVCGLQSREISGATKTIDVTTADCDDPVGTALNEQTMAVMLEFGVSGDFIFENKENFLLIHTPWLALLPVKLRITMPEIGAYECAGGWAVTELNVKGDLEGIITGSIGFKPTGLLDFTAI